VRNTRHLIFSLFSCDLAIDLGTVNTLAVNVDSSRAGTTTL
jgi:hypothetical protein